MSNVPAFIVFNGVDPTVDRTELEKLSVMYPVVWGMDTRKDSDHFVNLTCDEIKKFFKRESPANWSFRIASDQPLPRSLRSLSVFRENASIIQIAPNVKANLIQRLISDCNHVAAAPVLPMITESNTALGVQILSPGTKPEPQGKLPLVGYNVLYRTDSTLAPNLEFIQQNASRYFLILEAIDPDTNSFDLSAVRKTLETIYADGWDFLETRAALTYVGGISGYRMSLPVYDSEFSNVKNLVKTRRKDANTAFRKFSDEAQQVRDQSQALALAEWQARNSENPEVDDLPQIMDPKNKPAFVLVLGMHQGNSIQNLERLSAKYPLVFGIAHPVVGQHINGTNISIPTQTLNTAAVITGGTVMTKLRPSLLASASLNAACMMWSYTDALASAQRRIRMELAVEFGCVPLFSHPKPTYDRISIMSADGLDDVDDDDEDPGIPIVGFDDFGSTTEIPAQIDLISDSVSEYFIVLGDEVEAASSVGLDEDLLEIYLKQIYPSGPDGRRLRHTIEQMCKTSGVPNKFVYPASVVDNEEDEQPRKTKFAKEYDADENVKLSSPKTVGKKGRKVEASDDEVDFDEDIEPSAPPEPARMKRAGLTSSSDKADRLSAMEILPPPPNPDDYDNDKSAQEPQPQELWIHKRKGNIYRVQTLTNVKSDDREKFPLTVVYQNVATKEVWSRSVAEFQQAFRPFTLNIALQIIEGLDTTIYDTINRLNDVRKRVHRNSIVTGLQSVIAQLTEAITK